MKHGYMIVEGPHDAALVGRFMTEIHGAKVVRNEKDLDPFWTAIIPKEFPPEGRLLERVSVPVFYQAEGYTVAVHAAGGDSKIVKTLKRIKNLEAGKLSAIALFCDADEKTPATRLKFFTSKIAQAYQFDEDLAPITAQFASLEHPGQVSNGSPHVGIYVFPDNQQAGALDELLVQCGDVSYKALLDAARDYVKGVKAMEAAYHQAWKPSDENKALIGVVANIFEPGKANQVSIQNNDWICEATLALPAVAILNQFIKKLLDLT